jgi:hypothetical protein
MHKLGTRSFGYILEITSKVENFNPALKEGGFEEFWQFWGLSTLGVKKLRFQVQKKGNSNSDFF